MSRPVLTTARLRLDPLTEQHLEELVELDSDPEVLRFIFGRALTRDEVEQEWLAKRLRPHAHARGIGYWAGFVDQAFVGWWCLGVDDEDPQAAELGYRLRRTAWGRGYATEGSRAMLDHGFGTVGLARVWGETMAVNAGSRHVMEKLGMRLVRSYVGEWEYPLPGADQGEVVYEITRAAYLELG
ncbi:GNAT family N-acetyltransferase [Nocardioides sp.]|uniref:GNAT family N-acetyltransferase n=1 Tax=Nocardioides sp. TaxID=35761 RepID=UPI002ECFAF6E